MNSEKSVSMICGYLDSAIPPHYKLNRKSEKPSKYIDDAKVMKDSKLNEVDSRIKVFASLGMVSKNFGMIRTP